MREIWIEFDLYLRVDLQNGRPDLVAFEKVTLIAFLAVFNYALEAYGYAKSDQET